MIESPSHHKLAVVIPAFKGQFLAKALACLVRQTDQRFNLYICDDHSPADIQGIARSALGGRPYLYTRFENNLGGVSLAKHWDRCVALSSEPWVWLFSDDDLMGANCVESFNKFLETDGESTDLLRFDGWRVDEQDKIVEPLAFDLDRESWLEFAYAYLMNWRRPYLQRLVFRRSAFEKAGGFLDLPRCLITDAATIIALGRHRPIRQISGAPVFWRHSQSNLSTDKSLGSRKEILRAACLFLQWFQTMLQSPREHLFDGDEAAFQRAMDRFLIHNILNEGFFAAVANWNLLSRTRSQVCNRSHWSLLKYVAVAGMHDSISALEISAKVLGMRSVF